jgi:ribosomal protein L36
MENVENGGFSEAVYCGKCRVEGRDTLLFYSNPPKPTDTWTKRLANKKDYRCREHVRSDGRLYVHSTKNKKFKERQDKIEEYNRNKILEFERMWNDPRLAHIASEPKRLMEVFRLYDIRGQPGHEGFTAEEITEIVKSAEIEFSVSAFAEKWDRDNASTITRYQRELTKSEIVRALLPFEADIKEGNRRRVINSTRGMIEVANKLYENSGIYEKIVTTPGHRDPMGNISHRFHLLTYEETLRRRSEKKIRQIESINATMKREAKVQQEAVKNIQEADSDKDTNTV